MDWLIYTLPMFGFIALIWWYLSRSRKQTEATIKTNEASIKSNDRLTESNNRLANAVDRLADIITKK